MELEQYLNDGLATKALLRKKGNSADSWRMVNVLGGLLLLIVLSPLFGGIAILTWLSSGMPIFYGHWRVGTEGRLFRCLKFRTMVRNSEQVLSELLKNDPVAREQWQREFKLTDDPRITRIGGFLRRTSLDEFRAT